MKKTSTYLVFLLMIGFTANASFNPTEFAASESNGGAKGELVVIPLADPVYLDTCDDLTGWISTATLNTTVQKQGTGCFEILFHYGI